MPFVVESHPESGGTTELQLPTWDAVVLFLGHDLLYVPARIGDSDQHMQVWYIETWLSDDPSRAPMWDVYWVDA